MGYQKIFPEKFDYIKELEKCNQVLNKEPCIPKNSLIEPKRNGKINNYNQLRKVNIRKLFKKELNTFDISDQK